MIKDTTPVQDGFFMPGEFEQHQGCIMIWPERPGSWRNGAKEAETAFSAVIRAIAASETVYVAAGKKGIDHAKAFAESLKKEENLHPVVVFEMETDDSWARDVAPTFLVNRTDGKISDLTAAGNGTAQTGDDVKNSQVRGVNWSFNAWGGEVDGLYASYEKDGSSYEIWVEDAQSIAEKVKLIPKYKLAGVAQWKLGFENSSIWKVISENLK